MSVASLTALALFLGTAAALVLVTTGFRIGDPEDLDHNDTGAFLIGAILLVAALAAAFGAGWVA